MTTSSSDSMHAHDGVQGSVVVCAVAIVAGAFIGFVGGAFRWCLEHADTLRIDLSDWAHRLAGPGWLVPMVATALGAALAALVVRWHAAGLGQRHPARRGGVPRRRLAAGVAAASRQVRRRGAGASARVWFSAARDRPCTWVPRSVPPSHGAPGFGDATVRMLQTAVGGAGLAVAFNAPIGGVLFTLEEVTKSLPAADRPRDGLRGRHRRRLRPARRRRSPRLRRRPR